MYSVVMTMNTSERLIEATRELLWERGYVGTSPKAVQQAAGAGQGSMYHHFAGKQDLALAAIRRSAEELGAAADTVLGGGVRRTPASRRTCCASVTSCAAARWGG